MIESVETMDSVDSRLVLGVEYQKSISVGFRGTEVVFRSQVVEMPESELRVRSGALESQDSSRSRLIGLQSTVIDSPERRVDLSYHLIGCQIRRKFFHFTKHKSPRCQKGQGSTRIGPFSGPH